VSKLPPGEPPWEPPDEPPPEPIKPFDQAEQGEPPWTKSDPPAASDNPPPAGWEIVPTDDKPEEPNPAPPWTDDPQPPQAANPPPPGWNADLLPDPGTGLVWAESQNRSGYARDGDFIAKWAQMPDGVEFAWHDPSAFKESWGEDQPGEAKLMFWVPWGQNAPFKDWVLGGAGRDVSNGLLDRIIPVAHPSYPWLFASHAGIMANAGYMDFNPYVTDERPSGQGKKTPAPGLFDGNPAKTDWGKSLWEVTFRPRPYAVYSDDLMDGLGSNGKPLSEICRYVARTMTHAFQFLPIPQGNDTNSLRFIEGPKGIGPQVTVSQSGAIATAGQLIDSSSMNKFMFEGTAVYDWYLVPDLNTAVFAEIEGTTNNDVFDPPFDAVDATTGQQVKIGGALLYGGFPRGTLLCMAPNVTEKRDCAGKVLFDISFKFLYRPQGWNKFPASDGGFYEAGFNAGNPIPVAPPGKLPTFTFNPAPTPFYPYTDFDRLFEMPQQPRLWVGPRG